MAYIFSLIAICCFLIAPGIALAESRENIPDAPRVIAIEIDGEINAGAVEFVKRALKKGESENADLFLVKLDTPGGLLKATRDISRLLLDSPIKTAAFVHKKGGGAFSAGAYILLSAEISASHPEASIGAAEPRLLGTENVGKTDEKITEASASWIKRLAETRGKNIDVAEKFVRENLVLSGREALEKNIIDAVAEDTVDLLVKIGLEGAHVTTVEPTLLEKLLSFLSIPQIVPLLLTIGALGLVFTFRTGEVEIGAFAALALFLGLWGMGAISVSGLGAAFLVIGISFLIAELFVPEFGVFGIMGIVSFIAGIIFFGQEPLASPIFKSAITYFSIGLGLGIAAFFVIVGRLTAKTLRLKPASGLEALVGREGVVLNELSPYGRIKIETQNWRAKNMNDATISSGEKVEVTGFEGNTLFVRKKVESNE
jgi:membrane-bound serine protease (ClpP class)